MRLLVKTKQNPLKATMPPFTRQYLCFIALYLELFGSAVP